MVMESYLSTHEILRGPRRRKIKRRNELNPHDKGKTDYKEDYGL